MALFFDTETTGLPLKRPFPNGKRPKNKSNYRDLVAFDTARLVSLAWQLGEDGPLQHFFVQPLDFVIPPEATAIHGISQEQAMTQGISFSEGIARFLADIAQAQVLVAHNLDFDKAIIKSELLRASATSLPKVPRHFCTMREACTRLGLVRWPRLANLYRMLTGQEPDSAKLHTASYDVQLCCACYTLLLK